MGGQQKDSQRRGSHQGYLQRCYVACRERECIELLALLQVDNCLTVVRRDAKDLHDLLVDPWHSLGIYFSPDCGQEIWPRHNNCLAAISLNGSFALVKSHCSHHTKYRHATARRLRWPSKVPRTLPPSTPAHLSGPPPPITTSARRTTTAASSEQLWQPLPAISAGAGQHTIT